MHKEYVALLAGARRADVDEIARLVSRARRAEVGRFQIGRNDHRHEAAVGRRFTQGEHRRNALAAGLILNQECRIAGCVFRQILGQGSRDAILPPACLGADLQSDGLPLKVRLFGADMTVKAKRIKRLQAEAINKFLIIFGTPATIERT